MIYNKLIDNLCQKKNNKSTFFIFIYLERTKKKKIQQFYENSVLNELLIYHIIYYDIGYIYYIIYINKLYKSLHRL